MQNIKKLTMIATALVAVLGLATLSPLALIPAMALVVVDRRWNALTAELAAPPPTAHRRV